MTSLRDLFDEATAVAPPSRLSIEDIFAATDSRRRRRRRQSTLAAVCAIVLAVTGGVFFTARFAAHPPSGAAPPQSISWFGRGDAKHLYVVDGACPSFSPPPSGEAGPPPGDDCTPLLASSDGGATWTSRGRNAGRWPMVLGPLALMRETVGPHSADDYPVRAFELSTDGGAAWTQIPGEGAAINAVPPGGKLLDFGGNLIVLRPRATAVSQAREPAEPR